MTPIQIQKLLELIRATAIHEALKLDNRDALCEGIIQRETEQEFVKMMREEP